MLAGSVDGPFGWAWGARTQSREQRALEQCRQRGAVNCKVVETICTGTAGGPRTPARTNAAPPASSATPPANAAPNAGNPPAARDTRAPGTPTQLHRN